MESSFSSIFTPTLKKIAVVNYPAHSPPTSQGRRNCKGQGEIAPPPLLSSAGGTGNRGDNCPPPL